MPLLDPIPRPHEPGFLDRFSSFSALLRRWNRERPDAPAVQIGNTSLSWRWVLTSAEGIQSALERCGVKPGDRVIVHLEDAPGLIASIAAIDEVRAVYVPVNVRLPDEQKANICAISNAKFVLQGESASIGLPSCISVKPPPYDGLMLSTISNTRQEIALPWRVGAGHRLEEDFAVATTSATTAAAKAIVVNEFSVLATGYALATALELGPDTAILPMVPLTSHLSLCCSIPASFLTGAPLLIPSSRRHIRGTLSWAIENRLTLLVGVPTNYLQLLQSFSNSCDPPLQGLRGIVAGSVCDEGVIRAVRNRLGMALCNHYGMSEIGGVSSVCLIDRDEELIYRSTGLPFPWVEARLHNDGTEPAELLIRGPGLFRSSLSNIPEMQKRVSPEGWLHTGDFGTIGPSGEIRICGRAGDMAIRCGNNIFFAEIEAVFRESDLVSDAVAFSLPDPILGEAVCACIVLANGALPSAEDMFSFAAERLPSFKVPDFLTFRSQIETNLNGKVLRRTIQNEAKLGGLPLCSRKAVRM